MATKVGRLVYIERLVASIKRTLISAGGITLLLHAAPAFRVYFTSQGRGSSAVQARESRGAAGEGEGGAWEGWLPGQSLHIVVDLVAMACHVR